MKIKIMLCVTLVLVTGAGWAALNSPSLVNASFESVENGADPAGLGGWGYVIDDWFETDSTNNSGCFWEKGDSINLLGDGIMWVGSENAKAFYQPIGTFDGAESYIVTFWLGVRSGYTPGPAEFNLYAGGSPAAAADGVELSSLATRIDSVQVTTNDGTLVPPSTNVYALSLRLDAQDATLGDTLWLEFRAATGRNYFDKLTLDYAPTAWNPVPADNAVDVPLDQVLSWNIGRNDPNITGHYVYFGDNASKVAARDASVYRGLKVKGNETYNPADDGITMVVDKDYFWAIDESTNGSGTTDPNTISGAVWSFKSFRTLPDITRQPKDVSAIEGMDVSFSMEVTNPQAGELSYAWKAVGSPVILSTEPVFTIYSVTVADEGQYYCTVTNTTGPRDSEPATLSVPQRVVFWEFNETAGTTAADSSGNGFAGTVGTSGVWTIGGGKSGKAGDNALYLPGNSNGFVSNLSVDLSGKPVENIFLGTSSWTVNIWVKFDGKPGLVNIAGFGDCDGTGADADGANDATDRYFASWTDGSLEFEVGTDGFWPGTSLISSDWQMLTLSYDAAAKSGTMYFNGAGVSTKTGLTLADTTQNAFKINSGLYVVYGGIPGQLKGWVDDFCIFDGALTAGDVEYLYQGFTCPVRSVSDFNGDCVVDIADLVSVIENWLDCALVPQSACP